MEGEWGPPKIEESDPPQPDPTTRVITICKLGHYMGGFKLCLVFQTWVGYPHLDVTEIWANLANMIR